MSRQSALPTVGRRLASATLLALAIVALALVSPTPALADDVPYFSPNAATTPAA